MTRMTDSLDSDVDRTSQVCLFQDQGMKYGSVV